MGPNIKDLTFGYSLLFSLRETSSWSHEVVDFFTILLLVGGYLMILILVSLKLVTMVRELVIVSYLTYIEALTSSFNNQGGSILDLMLTQASSMRFYDHNRF
jgi:hypothetical protein